jgi:hypothetical protein
MAFTIELLEGPVPDLEPGDSAVYGNIAIDNFSERFYASTTYWSKGDYIKQWVDTIDKLIQGPSNGKGVLVACMYDPLQANFVTGWVLYRDGNKVSVQDEIIFLNELLEKFEIEKLDTYVGDRETVTEDGNKISEWETDLKALEECLRVLRK